MNYRLMYIELDSLYVIFNYILLVLSCFENIAWLKLFGWKYNLQEILATDISLQLFSLLFILKRKMVDSVQQLSAIISLGISWWSW